MIIGAMDELPSVTIIYFVHSLFCLFCLYFKSQLFLRCKILSIVFLESLMLVWLLRSWLPVMFLLRIMDCIFKHSK